MYFWYFVAAPFPSVKWENYFLPCLFLFSEGVNYTELDAKKPEDLTEDEKIALLGRPRLGDVTKLQIRIKESKEFKARMKIDFPTCS